MKSLQWWKLISRHIAPGGAVLSIVVPGFPTQESARQFGLQRVPNRLIVADGELHFVTHRGERWLVPRGLVRVGDVPLDAFTEQPTWLRDLALIPADSVIAVEPYTPSATDPYVGDVLSAALGWVERPLDALRRWLGSSYATRRKGMSKQAVRENRLDVYPRAGRTLDQIFAQVADAGFWQHRHGIIVPTLLGREAELVHTVGSDLEGFGRWLDACGRARGSLHRELARFRSQQEAPGGDDWYARLSADKRLGRSHRLLRWIAQQNPALEGTERLPRLLHVQPQLYLDPRVHPFPKGQQGYSLSDHARRRLDVAVFSNEVDLIQGRQLRIIRPYPNRNYHAASVDALGEGWFVPLPDSLDAVTVHVVWDMPTARVRVTQEICFHLEVGEGPLYGTACESSLVWHQPYGFAGALHALESPEKMVLHRRLRGSIAYVVAGLRGSLHVTAMRDEYVLTGMPLTAYQPAWLLEEETREWQEREREEWVRGRAAAQAAGAVGREDSP